MNKFVVLMEYGGNSMPKIMAVCGSEQLAQKFAKELRTAYDLSREIFNSVKSVYTSVIFSDVKKEKLPPPPNRHQYGSVQAHRVAFEQWHLDNAHVIASNIKKDADCAKEAVKEAVNTAQAQGACDLTLMFLGFVFDADEPVAFKPDNFYSYRSRPLGIYVESVKYIS